jgi:hypothetical protein
MHVNTVRGEHVNTVREGHEHDEEHCGEHVNSEPISPGIRSRIRFDEMAQAS